MRGVDDRHAPARHPTLATVNSEGKPQARTVVLRAADQRSATLDIHTYRFTIQKGHRLDHYTVCGTPHMGSISPFADAARGRSKRPDGR